MPQGRTPRPRRPKAAVTPAARREALAMIWRLEQIRAWKDAVHKEAWRQAGADGSHRCGCAEFDAAEARVEAAGLKRPPEAWFEEIAEVCRIIAEEDGAAD